MIKTFRDLNVWKTSHQLTLLIYQVTSNFPKEETYGLTSQLRRSAVSVPSNIAEGFKRKSRKDFAHFVNIAESSLEETKYQILLAKDLTYISEENSNKLTYLCDEAGRMLCGLYKKLNL